MSGKRKKVFVGLSGGVDSSVAAALLKEQGYDVTGVFIKVWHPEFMPCNWEQERVDAMRVAAHLDIPFLTCDGEAAYRDRVATYFIDSYQANLTPNPDVLCNQEVKFGVFLDFALTHGADYVATGHYAQVIHTNQNPILKRGIDQTKDQSYFLWSLTPEQLSKSLFPIGHLTKPEVRTLAKSFGLPTASKKDSQGVCFLGHIDIPEFLRHYLTLVPGQVKNKDGTIIGTHQGVEVYTIGQRHGFTITEANNQRTGYYVIEKDLASNTLIVSSEKPMMQPNDSIILTQTVIRTDSIVGNTYNIQLRYRQTPLRATCTNYTHDTLTLSLQEPGETASEGQSCVLYDDTICLGGGIIRSCTIKS